MFAYCGNNSVNAIDPVGEDAIWLQDANNQVAKIFGHTGLLIQDEEGAWYYFNWSNSNCTFYKIEEDKFDCKSLDSIKEYVGEKYDFAIYFEGDFSESVNYAQSLEDNYLEENYKLLWNNCMQVVVTVLMEGQFAQSDLWYKSSLSKAHSSVIPNVAFSIMSATDSNIQACH